MANEFVADLKASWTRWCAALVVSAAVTWGTAGVWDAQKLLQLATWVVIGMVVLPCAFVAALSVVGGVLLGALAILSLPAWLSGRPVGLGGLASELSRMVGAILPDYWRALRAVQEPWLWGAVAGFVGAMAARTALVGISPA